MPNHVTNKLTISGHEERVKELFEAIGGGKDDYGDDIFIDFNKILPMPKSLVIESSTMGKSGLERYTEHCEKAGRILNVDEIIIDHNLPHDERKRIYDELVLGEQYSQNIKEYGYPTWYDWAWSRDNWGTKWNAYSQYKYDDTCIEFKTAWCGIPNLIEKLSKMFPSLTISYLYADENWGCNVGEYVFEDGECVESNEPEDDSEKAREIATALLGEPYWENEDEEDEDEMEM